MFLGTRLGTHRQKNSKSPSEDFLFQHSVLESNRLSDHFAILTAPDDEQELRVRYKFLASHGVNPIWDEEGDWDAPGEILQQLALER